MERHEVLTEDLGFLLTRASAVVVRSTNDMLTPLGLRVRSYSVLALSCDEPDGVTQRQVAATMGLDPSQIVSIIDELEGRGLVIRTPDPSDRRNKLIVATDEGHRLYKEARRRNLEVQATHFAEMPPGTLDAVRDVLGKIVFPEAVEQP